MFTDSIASADIDGVLDRLSKKLGVTSDRALSLALNLSHSGVAMAKKKATLPYGAIVEKCMKDGISLDYIFRNIANQSVRNEVANAGNVKSDAVAAFALTQRILDDLLYKKNLPPERELLVRKKLQPILIDKVFEHNFNEVMVRTVAEGALIMT